MSSEVGKHHKYINTSSSIFKALLALGQACDESNIPVHGRRIILPTPDGFLPPTGQIEIMGFKVEFV